MANIPAWAWGLGTLVKGPEVANDWMGVLKNVNSLRDESNANDAIQAIQRFQSSGDALGYQPSGYLSPDTRQKLEALRQSRLDALLKQEAAPVLAESARLNRIAATDPYVGSAEGIADFAARPEFWVRPDTARVAPVNLGDTGGVRGEKPPGVVDRVQYSPTDMTVSGFVPGAKKGAPGATVAGGNPYVAGAVQDFGAGNQNILSAFRASQGDPMALARVAATKDLSQQFHQAQQGNKQAIEAAAARQEEAARPEFLRRAAAIEGTPQTPGSIGREYATAAADTGYPLKPVDLERFTGGQQKIAEGTFDAEQPYSMQAGSTTEKGFTQTNRAGKTVTTRNVTNKPRESSGDNDPANQKVYVSWIGADGTPQAATVPRSELPTLKASLETKGVKEINTIDGKRASRTETLIPAVKGRRGIIQGGGGTTPATTGGFKFVDGKLVPN